MSWRNAFNARDTRVDDKVLDMLEAAASGPVRLIATPVKYIDGQGTWHETSALAVTSKQVLVAAPKLLRGAKVCLDIPIMNFRRYATGPHASSLYEVYQELNQGGTLSMLFMTMDAAEAVAEYINSGVAMGQQSPS